MNDGSKKYYSSLADYNQKVSPGSLLAGVDYTESKEDPNSDGLKDELNVSFEIFESEIQSLQIYLFLTYKFEQNIDIEFTDMINVSNNVKSGFRNRVVGHIDLIQSENYNQL